MLEATHEFTEEGANSTPSWGHLRQQLMKPVPELLSNVDLSISHQVASASEPN